MRWRASRAKARHPHPRPGVAQTAPRRVRAGPAAMSPRWRPGHRGSAGPWPGRAAPAAHPRGPEARTAPPAAVSRQLPQIDALGATAGVLAGDGELVRVPVYTGLERTSQALHLAWIALASSPADDPMVNVFDDAPLPVLLVSSPTTSYRVTKTILGPLLDINPDERDILLNTLAAFFTFQGSAIEAGSTCTATPTRCATGCAASSGRPAARWRTPDRQRNYSSPWRRCARCPRRPVTTPDADRIRRRRCAR